jgi:hypothetical protein
MVNRLGAAIRPTADSFDFNESPMPASRWYWRKSRMRVRSVKGWPLPALIATMTWLADRAPIKFEQRPPCEESQPSSIKDPFNC